MDLTTIDLLLFYNKFEPSKIKFWEFVRRFDPIHMSAFLYLLENVTRITNSKPLTFDFSELYDANLLNIDVQLRVSSKPTINLDRGDYSSNELYLRYNDSNVIKRDLANFRNNRDSYTNPFYMLDLIKERNVPEDRFMLKVILHNLGTSYYGKTLKYLSHLLYQENLQQDREYKLQISSVLSYLQYYKMIMFKEPYMIDPRKFRFIITDRPKRVYERPMSEGTLTFQPLYNGFYLIVNSSNRQETRCFNRFGEIQTHLLIGERFNQDATFEVVLVPTDATGHEKSWHYWPYRTNYRIFITDIFRFEDTLLTNVPFIERLKYRNLLNSQNSKLSNLMSWDQVTQEYCDKMYHYISGIIIRDKTSIPTDRLEMYKFPISTIFDLYDNRTVKLERSFKSDQSFKFHYMLETASSKTVCIVYAHTDKYFYICMYNEKLHQFEHVISLRRTPHDCEDPSYKKDNIVVLNGKLTPMGVWYLRVYHDRFGDVYGYEHKLTTGKYDVPLKNQLYEIHKPR